MISLKYGNTMK